MRPVTRRSFCCFAIFNPLQFLAFYPFSVFQQPLGNLWVVEFRKSNWIRTWKSPTCGIFSNVFKAMKCSECDLAHGDAIIYFNRIFRFPWCCRIKLF